MRFEYRARLLLLVFHLLCIFCSETSADCEIFKQHTLICEFPVHFPLSIPNDDDIDVSKIRTLELDYNSLTCTSLSQYNFRLYMKSVYRHLFKLQCSDLSCVNFNNNGHLDDNFGIVIVCSETDFFDFETSRTGFFPPVGYNEI